MGIIVPAIIPTSRKDLEDKLSQLSGLCEDVQIDIVDGVFAGPASWPYAKDAGEPGHMLAEGELLPRTGEFRFEIDLMSADPESVAGTWIGLGASRLTVHSESTRFIPRFLSSTHGIYGHDADFTPGLLALGLSIGMETDLALIEPHLKKIDYVQFMGIRKIGHQGEPFDTRVFAKIATFRKRYPTIEIQVDGGVTLENAPKLLQAGVKRLVVGSALWKAPDLATRYREFDELTQRHGIYG
jgi:ribulose-phosphate 3-epimerase